MNEEQILKDLDVRASRFWESVDIKEEDECWPWMGLRVKGRAMYRWQGKEGQTRVPAAAVAYELVNGVSRNPVPRYCVNEDCTNPRHMEGTEFVKGASVIRDPSCVVAACKRVSGASGFCLPHEKHLQSKVG